LDILYFVFPSWLEIPERLIGIWKDYINDVTLGVFIGLFNGRGIEIFYLNAVPVSIRYTIVNLK